MKKENFLSYVVVLLIAGIAALGCSKDAQEKKSDEAMGDLSPAQQVLLEVWQEHLKHEFETKSTENTLKTMAPGAYVNHIPTLTGGVGLDEVGSFYSTHFIPQMPTPELIPISRTIGKDQIVDEMIFKFTHDIYMDWMLPGVAPTGKQVEVPLVAIIRFKEGKIAHEHIYWDQASVLVQLGLIDRQTLPVAGRESAQKVLDPHSVPSNELIKRAKASKSLH